MGTETAPLRLFTVAAELARTGRQTLLHLASRAPWADLVSQGIGRIRALTAPGWRADPSVIRISSLRDVATGAQRGDTRRTVAPIAVKRAFPD